MQTKRRVKDKIVFPQLTPYFLFTYPDLVEIKKHGVLKARKIELKQKQKLLLLKATF